MGVRRNWVCFVVSVGEAWDRKVKSARENNGKGDCGARSELAAPIFVSGLVFCKLLRQG